MTNDENHVYNKGRKTMKQDLFYHHSYTVAQKMKTGNETGAIFFFFLIEKCRYQGAEKFSIWSLFTD